MLGAFLLLALCQLSFAARLKAADLLTACVGSSHASMSLREDWRSQLRIVQKDIGFRSVRFHGLLDDDMSTYLNGEANLFNVFSTFDFLVSQNLAPIVELSFMPELLASNASETVFHYKGGISGPKDFAAWTKFIGQVVKGLVDRYTLKVVQQWKFEVWNEPNCGFLAGPNGPEGCCAASTCGPQDLYFKLYNATVLGVKGVNQGLQVGGPATAQTGWISDFVNFVTANQIPCDFVSTHLYPTDPNVPANRDGFFTTIQAAATTAKTAGYPLVVTEFNAGLGINAADGPYAASFVLRQLSAFQESVNVETLSFWTFSDIFEEQGLVSAPYSQQFGMMNIYDVPKPVYRAFQWISDLAALHHSVLSITTSNNVDVISMVVPNKNNPSIQQFITITTNFDVYPKPMKTEVVIVYFYGLTNPANVPKTVSIERIDETHGFARPIWEAAGKPMYPSLAEIKSEMNASAVIVDQVPLTLLKAGESTYYAQFLLDPYASARLYFEYNNKTSWFN